MKFRFISWLPVLALFICASIPVESWAARNPRAVCLSKASTDFAKAKKACNKKKGKARAACNSAASKAHNKAVRACH